MNTQVLFRSCSWGLLVVGAAGCGDTSLTPSTLESVVAEPFAARVLAQGDSVRFEAIGVFSDGRRMPVAGLWASRNGAVAVVHEDGWAVARGLGATVLRVEFQGKEGSASLVVHPDTVPPSLESVFAARTRVSVGLGPVVVPVVARFRDDDSGVQTVIGLFDGPLGTGITGLITFTSDSVETTPSGNVSVHQGALDIPGLVGVGTWRLSALRADDRIGNSRRWGAVDLERLGMAVEIVAATSGGG